MAKGEREQRITGSDIARFIALTPTGRRVAIVYLLCAAVLGLVLGITNASEWVSRAALVVFVATAVVVVFRLAIREADRQEPQ